MLKKKLEKNISQIEPFFEELLICHDKEDRPFLEVFVQEPENIAQKDLGTVLGIFEITDNSEDSSYIVNYLISVIKKEYFSRPKRGSIESFEAAIHRANLALAKLAEYENINWIGKINVLCAVIERQNLHLTQTGKISALLLRKGYLTNLGEGLSPSDEEINPLKTFLNLSSGRLENDDKLIIVTNNIFQILSPEEIKKSALSLSEKNFIQFMKTVMVNEFSLAGALLVDIKERKEIVSPPVKKLRAFNAFSGSTFSQKISSPKKIPQAENNLPEDSQKIGHIYIKESEEQLKAKIKTSSPFSLVITKEKIRSFFGFLKKIFRERIPEKISLLVSWIRNKNLKDKSFNFLKLLGNFFLGIIAVLKKSTLWILHKILDFFNFKKVEGEKGSQTDNSDSLKNLSVSIPVAKRKIKIFPSFTAAKNLFLNLGFKQKIYSFLALILIFVVPFFLVKIQKNISSKKDQNPVLEVASQEITLAQDKNVIRVENLNPIFSSQKNLLKLESLNGKILALSSSSVFDVESQEEFSFPESFGKIKVVSGMEDLDLLILISEEKQALTFSPNSKKFLNNTLEIPAQAEISLAGTYLTYLYLVDTANNQIYRYPRAEGGFGEKINWKKDETNISQASGIALNENLFLADPENLLKFFRGKRENFQLEETATKIRPFRVFSRIERQFLWILDKTNSRIVKLDPEGRILAQYYHPDISQMEDFTLNQEESLVYLLDQSSIRFFSVN